MAEVEYINNGDGQRTVKIIYENGSVERYVLSMDVPEHVSVIMQLNAEAQARQALLENNILEDLPSTQETPTDVYP